MDSLLPWSRAHAQGIPVRISPRLAERKKPMVRSQWSPASFADFEDDRDRIEPALANEIIDLSSVDEPAPQRDTIDLSSDDEVLSHESNEIIFEKEVIDLCSDDEAPASGCKPFTEKDIIDLSSDDEVSASENRKPSSEKEIIDLCFDYEPHPGNHKAAPLNNDRPSTRIRPSIQIRPSTRSRPREPPNSFGHRRLIASGSINGKQLDAIADSGASFSVISQELAGTLGLTIDQTSVISACLPSGTMIRTLGKTEGIFKFSGEEKSYILLCVVLEKCIHPLVLGSQFLRVTQTLTKHTNRIKNVFSNILSLNFLGIFEAEQYLLDGYLNGQAADIVPDTGSDIMVMSLTFAERLGLTIHGGPQHRTKVQFIDGSEVYTIGKVRGVRWKFQKWLDCGSHTRRRAGYDFHIIQHLPVDVIVSNDFVQNLEVFKRHKHRLVSRQPNQFESGIYGIRFIKSLRGHKKEQLTHGQSLSAEMEESELHRRDAAEEDIEENLTMDSVAAELKRLEEQERRRAQEEHKRRYDEARLSSMPQTATADTGGIVRPAQQSSTGSSVYDVNLTQHRNEASYQTQADRAPGSSFDAESGRSQARWRRHDLPGWLNGRR